MRLPMYDYNGRMGYSRATRRQGHSERLRYAVLCAVLTVFLVGTYIATAARGGHPGASQEPAAASAPLLPCETSDASFCGTERAFRGFVAVGDFSEILERQVATTASCSGEPLPQYCAGAQPGVPVRLTAVDYSGGSHLLPRNDYIAYFRAYFTAHGPFRFLATVPTNGGLTMQFIGKDGAHYDLQFRRMNGAWQFIAPSTSVV